MKNTNLILTCTLLLAITFSFSYAYKLINTISVPDYVRCITGGIILTTMIFHIMPQLYEKKNNFIGPFSSGISFLILFSIDKLYLSKTGAGNDCLPKDASTKQAIIFIIAMSLHSFMEGLGVPVKNNKEYKWYMFGLLGHKWIEAIVFGMSIFQGGFTESLNFVFIAFYSSLTPLGILAGQYSLVIFENCKKILIHILVGISAGSFFYIGFLEMLDCGFDNAHSMEDISKRIACVVAGFLFMALVNYICEKIEHRSESEGVESK